MWRDRRQPFAEHPATDAVWLTLGAVLLAAGLLVWTVGQVAAVLFGAHHPLPMPAEEMAGVLWNLPGHLDDPAQAWPRNVRGMLPGPVGMYAALVLVVWGPVLGLGLLVRWLRPRAWRERRAKGAKWASLWQLRRLLVLGPRPGRIILGRRDRWRDLLAGKLLLAVEQCHSVLAFGPPGSYKTHALVIPAALEWSGPMVATSIKPDLLHATLAHRASLGEVWVYDPLGLSGVPAAQWTPLAYCSTYAKAKRVGRMLADAADVQGQKADDANYWQLLGAKLLACVLYAAAGTGRSMADVARWVDVQDFDEVAMALGGLGDAQALDAWSACVSRPDNTAGASSEPPRPSSTSSATPRSPRAPRAATWTSTRCSPGRTTRCTCTRRRASRSACAPCSSSWSASSSRGRRSWPPSNRMGCSTPGCSCAWTRRATARRSRSSPSSPPPGGVRASSC